MRRQDAQGPDLLPRGFQLPVPERVLLAVQKVNVPGRREGVCEEAKSGTSAAAEAIVWLDLPPTLTE